MENLRQLHIIRGFSALYVAIGHSKVIFWAGGQRYLEKYPRADWSILDYLYFSLDMCFSAAQEFVIVFFILSGFLINHSFQRNKWKTTTFYLARLIRVVPPYLASVVFAVIVMLFMVEYNPYIFSGEIDTAINNRILNAQNELNLTTGIYSLFFLPNQDFIASNFSYWSLWPEMIFYATIPLLFKFRNWAGIGFVILYFILDFIGFTTSSFALDHIIRFSMFFYFGVLLYDLVKQTAPEKFMPNRFISFALVFLFLAITVGLGAIEAGVISLFAASLLTIAAILTLMAHPLRKSAFFKFGSFLGDVSYSLYVFHLPVFYLCYAIVGKITEQYIFYNRIYWLFIPIAIIVSYIFYRGIEKPSLHWIRKIKSSEKWN